MVTVKKGVNPAGKNLVTSNDLFGQDPDSQTRYTVLLVTRQSAFMPTDPADAVVYLKATTRRKNGVPLFQTVLLSELPKAFAPLTDDDEFWEVGKGDMLEHSAVLDGSVDPLHSGFAVPVLPGNW